MKFRFPHEFAPNPFWRAHPLAHQVPIATVRDDLYVLSDHSLAAVYRVRGMEYELADTADQVAFIDRLKSMLNAVPPGVQFKFLHRISHNYRDLLEEHLDLIDGTQPFARYVAWEQAKRYQMMMEQRILLRSENLIVLTYKPRADWAKLISSVAELKVALTGLTEKSSIVQRTLRQFESARRNFETLIAPVAIQMDMARLEPHRLSNEELYDLAWKILNPHTSLKTPCPRIRIPNPKDAYSGLFADRFTNKAISKKRSPIVVAPLSEREQLVQSDWSVKERHVRTDGLYYGAIWLRALPAQVFPTMSLRLAGLPFESTLSFDCYMLQKQAELEKQWAKAKQAKSQSATTMFEFEDPDPAEIEAAQAKEERYKALANPAQNPFRFRLVIVVSAESPDELEERMDHVSALVRELENAQGVREQFGVDEVIKSTWPFAPITDFHCRKAMTSEIAYLLPVFSRTEGSRRPVALVMDRMNRLVKHDPYPTNLYNKNRVITGKSGTGKSFLCNLADVQPHAARKNTEVMIIESGASFKFTAECYGGQFIRLGPRSGIHINAFDLPPGFEDMDPATQTEELKFKYAFIKNLVLVMAGLTDPRETQIAESVVAVVAQRTYAQQKTPRLRDFNRLLKQYRNDDDPEATALAKRIGTLIKNYVVDENGEAGIYADTFDCFTDFQSNAPLIAFDLMDVKNDKGLMKPLMMVVLLGLVYNRVMQRDGVERYIVIDEAWALLKEEGSGVNPAGDAIELFYREGRKLGSSSTIISQNISDMFSDRTGRAVIGNCTIFYFLNHQRLPANDEAFKGLNFSSDKMKQVYELTTVYGQFSEVMVNEGERWGIVRLPSSGLRYWIASTDPKDYAIRERYMEFYGKGCGLETHVVLAILAQDYPYGAHGAQGQEMAQSEALIFAQRWKARYERFADMVRQGQKIPLSFR